jgi:hypothetical protein
MSGGVDKSVPFSSRPHFSVRNIAREALRRLSTGKVKGETMKVRAGGLIPKKRSTFETNMPSAANDPQRPDDPSILSDSLAMIKLPDVLMD